MNKTYQTIIIGAGPAGLIAGKYLKDTLILDKKQEIGKPVQCGEGISKKALEIQGIAPNPAWISCEIHKVERIMSNGKAIGKFHKEPIGYVIDREIFEKHLAQNTKSEIKLNTEVIDLQLGNQLWKIITKTGEVFRSKYIIGADGFNSIVRQKVFPENQKKIEFFPAIEYLVEIEKELDTKTIKIYLDNEKYNQGYAWIFPKSRKRANIGVGGKGNLSKAFEEFLSNKVKNYYGNYQLLKNKSGVVSLNDEGFLFLKSNAILIGDAAGLADPLFKGGINQAMNSAKIATECILKEEVKLYDSKIKLMPFADPKLIEAKKILYSFDNETLNELGEILEGKDSHYLKTLPGIIKILSKPYLRKNFLKLFKFFVIWKKNKDYLW